MASYSTLLLPLIKEVLFKEIGEANLTPLTWKRVSTNQYKFLVDINDFTEVVTVEFDKLVDLETRQFFLPQKFRNLEEVYNVGYMVSGTELQAAKSDLKTLLTVLSTVVDIVKHFLDTNDVDGLYIRGTAKDADNKDTSQKTNLYQAFVKKQLQQIPGFGFDTYRAGFILIKK